MKTSSKKHKKMIKYTKKQLEKLKHKSKTDFSKLDALSDADIDYTNLPELDDTFWVKSKVMDHEKKPISIRVDSDVLAWFKHQKGRYQKLMNYVLRQYMNAHRRH